jgi:hypothetical protein
MSSLLSGLLFFRMPMRAICRWPLIIAIRNTHEEAERCHAERNLLLLKIAFAGSAEHDRE